VGVVIVSQGVEIVLVVQGLAALFQAAVEAGAEYRAQKRLQTADGKTHDVDYVATDSSGAEVGVKVDQKTQRVALVHSGEAGRALAGRIQQRYAYSRVLEELKRKGYQLAKEEKQADGTVKVVLQRWR
jgi:Protein of unknown function (DUF1257)